MAERRSASVKTKQIPGALGHSANRPLGHASLRADLRGLLWISPWLVGFAAFLALPLGMSLYYSLTDYSILEAPLWIGADNYRALAADPTFWKVMKNTVVYALVSIPLGTITALGLAVLLNHDLRGISIFRAAVFLPTFVPLVAAAMVWMWLFNGDFGLINRGVGLLLAPLGIPFRGPNWLEDAAWNMPALVIMSLWMIGRAVVIYLAALQGVPRELYEAGHIDGMGPWRRLANVTLPMISPVILFNVIIAIIDAWQVFATPYVLTKAVGGPDKAMYFYTHYLYDNAFLFGPRMGYACAMAWVQLVIILGLTVLTFCVSRRYVYYRAA